jgi:hypothetical protein
MLIYLFILKKNHFFNAPVEQKEHIADKSLSKEERLIIVECLEFNYKVYIVPLIADWKIKRDIPKSKTIQI